LKKRAAFSQLNKLLFGSLLFRIYGMAFLTFLIGLLIYSYIEYEHINQMEKRIITQMGDFASTFSLAAREAILTLNYPLIENYVSQVSAGKEDLKLVAVFDRQGELIHRSSINIENLNFLNQIQDELVRKSTISQFVPFFRYLSPESYLVVKPIKVEGKGYGWVAMVFSLSQLERERVNFLYGALLVAGILLIAFFTTSLYLRAKLIKPVLKLAEASRELAEGKFSTKISLSSSGELEEVEKAFNQMVEKLKRLTDGLVEAQEALKSQVSQLNFLYNLSQNLNSTLELTEIFELGLEAARKIISEITTGGYFLFEKEKDQQKGEKLNLVYYQMGEEGEIPVLGEINNTLALNEEKMEIFRRGKETEEESKFFLFPSSTVSLWLPLKSRRELLGYLVLETSKKEGLKEEEIDTSLLSTFADELAISIQNALLNEETWRQYFRTIAALAEAIEAKDPSTRGHCNRVAHYATLLARRLGFNEIQIAHLQTASYLHDVGKIAVPEAILCKPGPLNEEEREIVKTHSLRGYQLVEAAGLDPIVKRAILEHHEWFDGRGYPEGRKGTEISLEARILAIADAFEAMISERPYRPAKSIYQAQRELKKCAGSQFDPMLVTIFLELIGERVIYK